MKSDIPSSTHGHVVLRWLAAEPMTIGALKRRCAQALGDAAEFHTCDTTGLDLRRLLALLAERGKVRLEGDCWRADTAKICAH
jgi:probable metal-binding protein